MRSPPVRLIYRRTIFVNPRLQGGIALSFAAVIFAAGSLFAWMFHREAAAALRGASLHGHYLFHTPYDVVGGTLARHVAGLFAGVTAASFLLFLLLVRRVRKGIARLVDVFRISGEGDLSTPAEAPGLREAATLGKKMDAAREKTLALIKEIGEEVELLRKEPLSPEEFGKRWSALKRNIAKVAP